MTVFIDEDNFGHVMKSDGNKSIVRRFTLHNNNVKLQVINYGATISSLSIISNSKFDDIVLGYDNISCKLVLNHFKHSLIYVMYFTA